MLRVLAILLCLMLGNGTAAAAAWDRLATPYFNHIGRENGLPHDIVMDMAQDNDGAIWIATQGGLARWDGYRLHAFNHVDGDAGSLPDSTVMRLLVDSSGRLWVATISGLIARFDAATERFETVSMPDGGVGVPGGLVDDGAGGVWVGGTDGLAHATATSWQRDSRIEGDVNAAVRCLMRSHDGTIWACGTTRLYRRAPQGGQWLALDAQPDADPIRSMMEDAQGRIWFGTDHSGIGLLDPATGKRTMLAAPDPASGQIRELAPSGPDEVWGVLAGTGIIQANAVTGAVTHITSRDGPRGALGTDTLYAVMRDRSGLLWVGGLGGVWYRAGGPALVDTIWPALDPQHGPWGLDVLSLCGGSTSSRIWIGTLRAGLLTVDPGQGDQAVIQRAAPDSPADAPVVECAVGPDGTVYAGQRKGFARLAPGEPPAKAESIVPPALDAAGAVRSIAATRDALWLGTDAGLFRADPHGEIQDHYEYEAEDGGGLTNNSVEILAEDHAGSMWAGTHRGLNRIDEKTGTIEKIMPNAEADSLPGLNISTLLFDRRGRLWVGTIGGSGIGVLEHPEIDGPRHFRRIGTAEGLPSPNIGVLLEDAEGRIWASSTDGLFVIDPIRCIRAGSVWRTASSSAPTGRIPVLSWRMARCCSVVSRA
ncbi:MAG: two-component regulator propeller domain-containing protein [Aliidongia sp.]